MDPRDGNAKAFIRPPALNVGSTERMVEELLNEEERHSSQSALTEKAAPETTAVAQIGTLDVPQPLVTLKALIEDHFPMYWSEVEAGLSVAATLRLKAAANPVCLIYEGDASSGKTTVAEMFVTFAHAYLSDRFSPAAFVSHASNRTGKDLDTIDLLPKIKHKLFITPELGPTFSGKDTELEEKFAILTRVLDGRGLKTDSGVHGSRGYRGDYFFVWIGCTTPIDDRVWNIMGKLGSRIVTWKMLPTERETIDDLVNTDEGLAYVEKLSQCTKGVQEFLAQLFQCTTPSEAPTTRVVEWDVTKDPRAVKEWIARCALLMAEMRSKPAHEPDPTDEHDRSSYVPARREGARRFYALLCELAQGHALVYGRRQLTMADLPLVIRITVSSMPRQYSAVFEALVRKGPDGHLTRSEVEAVLGVKHPETARKVMERMGHGPVMEYVAGTSPGPPSLLRLSKDWRWCGAPEITEALTRSVRPSSDGAEEK